MTLRKLHATPILALLREKAGFRSMAAFARHIGEKPQLYWCLETGKGGSERLIQKVCAALKIKKERIIK